MKQFSLICTTLIGTLLLFTISCGKKDKSCPSWYDGDNCQTEMRQKFYGTYTGIAHATEGDQFNAKITLSAGSGGVQNIHVEWILNDSSGSDGNPVVWNIQLTSSTAVDVPVQTVPNNPLTPGIVYSDKGSGSLDGNAITFSWVSGNTKHWSLKAEK